MADDVVISRARLELLLHTLEQIAAGNPRARFVPSEARDAFDAIGFAINIMADEVQFRYAFDAQREGELKAALEKLEQTLEELRETQAQLVQSAKMAALGEFSSGLAHEINNPLAVIQGYVSQIETIIENKEMVKSDDLVPALRKINNSIDRMAKIVRHVQDFSRRGGGDHDNMAVNEIVLSALDFVREGARRRGIELQVDLAEPSPMITANATALEHVILNLISNACDAIEERGPGFKGVVLIKTATLGREVVIEICDNGMGIKSAHLEKIYQPFFTTKIPGRGTGVGLSISYRIVQAHKGRIECESTYGEGSTFRVVLPKQTT